MTTKLRPPCRELVSRAELTGDVLLGDHSRAITTATFGQAKPGAGYEEYHDQASPKPGPLRLAQSPFHLHARDFTYPAVKALIDKLSPGIGITDEGVGAPGTASASIQSINGPG